jgi:hypothetical protein
VEPGNFSGLWNSQFSVAVDRIYRVAGRERLAGHCVRAFSLLDQASGSPQLLGEFMLVASLIPLGDAAMVLRSGGSRKAAFGMHGCTALMILATGVIVIGSAK